MRKNKSIATGGLWQDFLREPAPMRFKRRKPFCNALVVRLFRKLGQPVWNSIYKNRLPISNQIPI
jgi:hypothetical protein